MSTNDKNKKAEDVEINYGNVVDYKKESTKRPLVKFGKDFIDNFFFDETGRAIDVPITSLRIIYLIYEKFYSKQFDPKSEAKQLELFEEEFLTEHNTYAEVRIKNSRICPTDNHTSLDPALAFLAKYKQDWNFAINSKGQKIKTFGGLISNVTVVEKGFTQFLISSYWLKQIVQISQYNYLILESAFKIQSNKRVLFLLWLSKVNLEKGTRINYTTLNYRFSVNYSTARDLSKGFLAPIKKDLDLYSNLSFNYSIKKDNITIMPYKTDKSIVVDLPEGAKKTVSVASKLAYIKKRHAVEDDEFKLFSERYSDSEMNRKEIEDAYTLFKGKCRKTGKKMQDYIGKDFLHEIQGFIIAGYNSSRKSKILPNGYLRII